MAISYKQEIKGELVIDLARGNEEESRTLSIVTGYTDVTDETAMTKLRTDLEDFAKIFVGGDSATQLGGISANQFIQPSAWRDNDDSDAPWTTAAVTPRIIETTTIILDKIDGGGGGGENTRNFRAEGNEDDSSDTVSLYFDGLVSPVVSSNINGEWQTISTTLITSSYYRFNKVEGMTSATIYLPPKDTYEAYTTTIPISF